MLFNLSYFSPTYYPPMYPLFSLYLFFFSFLSSSFLFRFCIHHLYPSHLFNILSLSLFATLLYPHSRLVIFPLLSSITLRSSCLADIYLNTLLYNLTEVGYQAMHAQLEYNISVSAYGLLISISGFDHKISVSNFYCVLSRDNS